MASTQTPHYHLNQWISTDAVQRVEFNQNFTAIDTALHTLDQNLLLRPIWRNFPPLCQRCPAR